MNGRDARVLVCQDKQVAIFGFPRVATRITDGRGIAITHHGEGGQEIGLTAEGELLLMFDEFEQCGGIAGVLLNVQLRLSGGVVTDAEKCGAGYGRGEEYEEQKELRPQA